MTEESELIEIDNTLEGIENVTEEQLRKQTEATKKKIAEAVSGKNNGLYKDGRRSYRNKAGAKDNDGSLVHHKDGDSKNNAKSNLEKIPESKRSEHEKKHHRENNFHKSGGRKPVARGYKSKT